MIHVAQTLTQQLGLRDRAAANWLWPLFYGEFE
jgi:hypothetical protein